MCGIAGILNLKALVRHPAAIQAMTDRIAHRGPDAEGIYVDDHIALGHRRLSIIDLSEQSNQPMWDHSGRYAIVYNGEIYNYQDVKARLTSWTFKTQSDTEVILASYVQWGSACVKEFNGMFAFAIWDAVDQTLFMARDRLGKKPFYYYLDDRCLIFSSEVRSLLASGLVPRQLDERYLAEYLTYQAAMGDHTMVRNVKRLKAGHFAWIQFGTYSEHPYWNYAIPSSADDSITAQRKVKELLIDAVRLRMIADVPLGAFLSGGIDSGLIVACMAELSDQPVNTFTVSFQDKRFDESDFAQKIATKYNTRHHRILLQPQAFLESLEDILASMDSLSGDGPNTYMVAKHTREAGIKVALSGLGGDELFVGYNKFLMYRRLMSHRWLLLFPGRLRQILAERLLAIGPGHKADKFAQLLHLKSWDLSTVYPVLRRVFGRDEIKRLLITYPNEDFVENHLANLREDISHLGEFSQWTVGELETYTRDVLLRDTDQMSMAHALEVRVPFFDYRLVAYVLSLRDTVKFPHTPKQLLVNAMHPRLPREISARKKMGFSLPWEQWLRHELSGIAEEKFKYLADRKEFNSDAVFKKWGDFKKGDSRIGWSKIWMMVVLSDWLQRNQL